MPAWASESQPPVNFAPGSRTAAAHPLMSHLCTFDINQPSPGRALRREGSRNKAGPEAKQKAQPQAFPSHPRSVSAFVGKPEPSMKVRGCRLALEAATISKQSTVSLIHRFRTEKQAP